ncbi:response regulator transcription factor [Pontibacillus yanchengensis]|uniref:Heme response regulator HssR n=1 Tax=Pontibacillus yanchengensis Y32 TaxID=1385514 RepID=A0A0A2TF78_9BACI|nr:response regulator transcription factor [Pontibacillus yanchengensis]KGP72761.1 heme response regulator HssR [Pontibacillus yanchengensis Y32]
MIRILIADDDPNIVRLVALYIKNEGYEVVQASDGEKAMQALEQEQVDLAIIDIMMPKVDGYELCREIRQYYEIPVLMLTAKGETHDKIKGFELGTDDYVVKPFEPMELMMRVKALLRRYKVQSSNEVALGNITMFSLNKEALVNGQKMNLALKEFELLFTFASYPEQIFTRNQLIEKIWGLDYEGDDRTVDVHVKRVREKLKRAHATVEVKTIRGLGYRLEVGNL